METYAVLDDGLERSIVLPQALQQPNIICHPKSVPQQTVHQCVKQLDSASVILEVWPLLWPSKKHLISHTFTADGMDPSEHMHPVLILQQKYNHLRELPYHQLNLPNLHS